MTALLQEGEDILKDAEQQCLDNRHWQELEQIEQKKHQKAPKNLFANVVRNITHEIVYGIIRRHVIM